MNIPIELLEKILLIKPITADRKIVKRTTFEETIDKLEKLIPKNFSYLLFENLETSILKRKKAIQDLINLYQTRFLPTPSLKDIIKEIDSFIESEDIKMEMGIIEQGAIDYESFLKKKESYIKYQNYIYLHNFY